MRSLASSRLGPLLLALAALLLGGCASGQTPSGVRYEFVFGGAEAIYDRPMSEVYATTAAALEQFELTLGERSKDAFEGRIVAYDQGTLDHIVTLKRLAPRKTRIWVAVNPPWGVPERSEAILNRIDQLLYAERSR